MANHSIKLVLCTMTFGLLLGTTALAQTDEELREEIRKEVREELRKHEEAKALEERKARIRKEELLLEREREQKLEDERRLTKRAEEAKIEKKPVDDKLVRRLNGWSISAHFGPNFPLGKFGSDNVNDGHFAALGYEVSLNNTIHFGNVMGIHIGLGYERNPMDDAGLVDALRKATDAPSNVIFNANTKAFDLYTVRVGPVIRAIGRGAAFHFRPYIGVNFINGGSYNIDIRQDGASLGTVYLERKTTTAFFGGAAIDLSIHAGRSSDIVFGLELNMTWRSMFYEYYSTVEAPKYGSEDMELIRLIPMIGYRFHL